MLPRDTSVYLGTESIDLRWSFDILCGLVRERLDGDPRSGALFVFFGRRGDRLKILFYDTSGYCILYKRLDRGTFRLPEIVEPGAVQVAIDPEELALMLEGLSLPKKERPRRRSVH